MIVFLKITPVVIAFAAAMTLTSAVAQQDKDANGTAMSGKNSAGQGSSDTAFVKKAAHVGGGRFHVSFDNVSTLFADPGTGGVRARLLNLTNTVDVGDVAVLGIAVALLVLTPDPPGGLRRAVLLQLSALLSAIIAVSGLVRAITLLTQSGISDAFRLNGFVGTVGVAIAAATIAFYAAKESFLKKATA